MKEQLISFETAKLAKDMGFNIETSEVYVNDGWLRDAENIVNRNMQYFCYAPSQFILQKWLRGKHLIFVDVNTGFNEEKISHSAEVMTLNYKTKGLDIKYQKNGFKTYEKALEKGLYKGLKLIKNI